MSVPTVLVDDCSIIRMIMEYLRKRGFNESIASLHLESGLEEISLPSEIAYLQQLVLKGRWNDCLLFCSPLRQLSVEYDKIECLIRKQQYLEALSWYGGCGSKHSLLPWFPTVYPEFPPSDDAIDVEILVNLLKSLEKHCPQEEFNVLCECLTLKKLSDCPQYSNWTVSKGRLETSWKLAYIIDPAINKPNDDTEKSEISMRKKWYNHAVAGIVHPSVNPTSSLVATIAMSIAYQMDGSIEYSGLRADADPPLCVPVGTCIALPDIDVLDVLATAPHVTVVNPIENKMFSESQFDAVSSASADLPTKSTPSQSDSNIASSKDIKPASDFALPEPPTSVLKSSTSKYHLETVTESVVPAIAIKKPKPVAWTVELSGDKKTSSAQPSPEDKPPSYRQNQDSVKSKKSLTEAVPPPKPPVTQGKASSSNQIVSNSMLNAMEIAANERELELQEYRQLEKEPSYLQQNQQQQQQQQQQHQQTQINNGSQDAIPAPSIRGAQSASKKAVTGIDIDDSDAKSAFSQDTMVHKHVSRTVPSKQPLESQPVARVMPEKMSPQLLFESTCPLRSVVGLYQADYNQGWACDTLAVGSNSKSVHIVPYGPTRSQDTAEFQNVHNGSVYCMDWSWKNNLLATGSNDKTIRLINVAGNIVSAPLKGHNGTIRVVKLQGGSSFANSSNDMLASGGAGDCQVRLWDINTGTLRTNLQAHPDAVHGIAWLNDNILVTGCDKGILQAHDTRSPQSIISTLNINTALNRKGGGICCIERLYGLSMDASVVIGCTGGLLAIVDLKTMSITAADVVHKDDIRSIATSSRFGSKDTASLDAVHIVSTSYDATAAVWNMQIDRQTNSMSFRQLSLLQGHEGKVLSAFGIPGQRSILTSGADGRVLLWDKLTSIF